MSRTCAPVARASNSIKWRRHPDHSTRNSISYLKKLVSSKMNLGISRYLRKTTLHVKKRSLILNMSTSCPLEPNYSYRAEGSTSHVIYFKHCAAAQRPWARKPRFESRNASKIMIFMILRPLGSQVAHLSFSCPGIKLN